ncbi:hypothetical protein ACWD04_02965 [Streptomyces sp. NPDC002911]
MAPLLLMCQTVPSAPAAMSMALPGTLIQGALDRVLVRGAQRAGGQDVAADLVLGRDDLVVLVGAPWSEVTISGAR